MNLITINKIELNKYLELYLKHCKKYKVNNPINFDFDLFINNNIYKSNVNIIWKNEKLFDMKICIENLENIIKENILIQDIYNELQIFYDKNFCKTCNNILDIETDECIKCIEKKIFTIHNFPSCSICLENINNDFFLSKCNHYFHYKCIIQVENNTCPLCRSDLS
jgi:hypothetical protein